MELGFFLIICHPCFFISDVSFCIFCSFFKWVDIFIIIHSFWILNLCHLVLQTSYSITGLSFLFLKIIFHRTEFLHSNLTECSDFCVLFKILHHPKSDFSSKYFKTLSSQWNLYSTQNWCFSTAWGRDGTFTSFHAGHQLPGPHLSTGPCPLLSSWCVMSLSSQIWFLLRCGCFWAFSLGLFVNRSASNQGLNFYGCTVAFAPGKRGFPPLFLLSSLLLPLPPGIFSLFLVFRLYM